MKKLAWLVLAFCSLLLVACSGGQNQSGKLKVMTTFYPVYEFTKQVYQVAKKSMTMREGQNTIMSTIPMSGFLRREPLKWWKRFVINW